MIIDSHVHVVGNPASNAPNYITVKRDAVLLRRRHPDVFAAHWDRLEDMSDLLIEDMDAFGIDKAIVQPARGESPELVAQAVAKYPDRLVGLFMSGYNEFVGKNPIVASGPTQKPDLNQFADNVRHWVEDLGLRGFGEFGVRTFSEESDPSMIARDLMPVMEIINEYKIPVLIHTAWTQFGTKLYHGIPMFVDDLAEQFPEIPFTLTKMGPRLQLHLRDLHRSGNEARQRLPRHGSVAARTRGTGRPRGWCGARYVWNGLGPYLAAA